MNVAEFLNHPEFLNRYFDVPMEAAEGAMSQPESPIEVTRCYGDGMPWVVFYTPGSEQPWLLSPEEAVAFAAALSHTAVDSMAHALAAAQVKAATGVGSC